MKYDWGFPLSDFYDEPFIPYHQDPYSPYCSLYITQGADKVNLLHNQEILLLLIIIFLYPNLYFNVWFRGDIVWRN